MNIRKLHIYCSALIALLLVSCNDDDITGNGDINILPRYIAFGTNVSTRGTLVTEMNERTFNVVAYNYDKKKVWSSIEHLATPMQEFQCPQPVICQANGVCAYDADTNTAGNQNVPWNNTTDYVFHAYYPAPATGNGITASIGKSTVGAPYINFDASNITDPANLPDIMTSMLYVDGTDGAAGDGLVNFTFKHRLSCLAIQAINKTQEEKAITKLSITFRSPVYRKAKIYLDPSKEIEKSSPTSNYSVTNNPVRLTYTIISSETTIAADGFSKDISGNKNILLIPRNRTDSNFSTANDKVLKGTITVRIKGEKTDRTTEFTIDEDLLAGRMYSIVLTFLPTGTINAMVYANQEWDDYREQIRFE